MQVHSYRVPSEPDQPHWRFLCSDMHLGSPNVDLKRLAADLDAARRVGARVLINGDVFDAIDCRDKRWAPNAVVKELRGSHTLAQDVVKYAFRILEPYADLVDVIGVGNHEEKWVKWNALDPVSDLIERLNGSLERQGSAHRVRHGGIAGFLRTVFEIRCFVSSVTGRVPSVRHTLFYHHGSGGDAPVTKGMIDFARKLYFVADAVTMGHRHSRFIDDDAFLEVTPSGLLRHRERKALQTGSYYLNYRRTGQANPLAYSYAESAAHKPKPTGGLFLELTPSRLHGMNESKSRRTSAWVVRQEVHTSPGANRAG